MLASGMPIATMRAPTADAMAKQLFMEEDWPAELAVAAARAVKGDWHQLRARKQLCPDQVAPRECSGKDASIANAAPCIVANRLLNGTAPESCPLDQSVVALTERNLGVHCETIEEMAMRQEAMAASTGAHAGDAIGEELFRQAAGMSAKRVQYLPGLYTNPYQKDESSASTIKESFERHRATHVRLLAKRVPEDASRDEQEEATKPKAKARRAAKSRAAPKRATRVAPPRAASGPC